MTKEELKKEIGRIIKESLEKGALCSKNETYTSVDFFAEQKKEEMMGIVKGYTEEIIEDSNTSKM